MSITDKPRVEFMLAVAKVKEKLRKLEMGAEFYPEMPMRMLVVGNPAQISMEEDEDFSLELVMYSWGDVQYRIDGNVTVPAKLLSMLKKGFLDIAGAYMMMQHWIECERRASTGAPRDERRSEGNDV
jgi:hypothetical protein